MGSFIDRTGQVFGNLTVISCTQRASRSPRQKTKWLCKCSCGEISEYLSDNLTTGNSSCCTYCRTEKQVIHGCARRSGKETTYASWNSMKSRCTNPNNLHYDNYGGRGLSFCESWEDFTCFLSDMGERPEGMTLERLDVNLGYYKGNCIWASRSVQSYNRRKDKRNTSGTEGVSLRKDTGKWTCYIDKEGVRYRLGCYDTKEEAISVRRDKEIELYGKIKEN